ncbi:hypothetical protein [Flavobacterium tyrosinilyticum]|uniref:hypothetical protein n=1 Tax=Flavobacterium tyrosinilyticum TaxID=1658740 RepID=UPI00202DDDB4|nr:hypothetical protein [Flavobacterium tyrosinilyticum]MCM0666219.1 hypothetical protein [Flavobacterium tyrosinilyticum]
MKNKFIRRYQLTKWNIITICSYFLLSIFLLSYGAINKIHLKEILFFYGFGTQFFIYGSQYRALRNFNCFLIWTVIGIIHFCIFLSIKDSVELAFVNGHASLGLRSTLITLLLFQFLRYLSLKIQGKELVVPSKNSRTDLLGERKTTVVDIFLFFIFIGVTMFFLVTE